MTRRFEFESNDRPVRYAVVGAGHIAQNAVLPGFARASRNSRLTALVSGNPRKRRRLAELYEVEQVWDYRDFDEACASGRFDAVYIALPNSMHCEYTCRAAEAGVHVLCEKPMATSSRECRRMIDAAEASGVKLMVAYRLHFEPANLEAIELVQSGELGTPRYFQSAFSMQVRAGNIRLRADLGGGPLFDLGIYCINAARYLFRAEPIEAAALSTSGGGDERFAEVEESLCATLRFPGDRLATFTCSFGAADVSHYQVVGTRGDLRVDPAYEYEGELRHSVTIEGRNRTRTFRRRDQFGPELLYFSDCIQNDYPPEPGALEGLNDVRIIEALHESAAAGQFVPISGLAPDLWPEPDQVIRRRPARKKELIDVQSAHVE